MSKHELTVTITADAQYQRTYDNGVMDTVVTHNDVTLEATTALRDGIDGCILIGQGGGGISNDSVVSFLNEQTNEQYYVESTTEPTIEIDGTVDAWTEWVIERVQESCSYRSKRPKWAIRVLSDLHEYATNNNPIYSGMSIYDDNDLSIEHRTMLTEQLDDVDAILKAVDSVEPDPNNTASADD